MFFFCVCETQVAVKQNTLFYSNPTYFLTDFTNFDIDLGGGIETYPVFI